MGKGIVHKIGSKYIEKSMSKIDKGSKEVYVLSDSQKKQIRKITYETYFWSALIGIVAVLAVVLPFHAFPSFFGEQTFTVFGTTIKFELFYTIFAILMLFPEIWALNFVNLRAVKKICLACNYPSSDATDFQEQVDLLTEAGLEMPAKHLELFNIDPYIGLSKFSYYSLFILNKLKATLTNVVVKLLVKRFLGRYALRIVTDLAGIPIFAFWNAWASHGILKETKMRIMASAATQDFIEELDPKELQQSHEKIGILFHFIAQQKRSYNYALFAYMKEIIRMVPEAKIDNKEEIKLEQLFDENSPNNKLIAKMLVFGFIVDGSISIKERLTLKKMSDFSWFDYTIESLEEAVDGYLEGKGLPTI
jgi:hypothetical protein